MCSIVVCAHVMLRLHVCGLSMLCCSASLITNRLSPVRLCLCTWESVCPRQLAVANSSCTAVSLSQNRPTSFPSGEPAKIIWRILFWRHISHRPKATDTLSVMRGSLKLRLPEIPQVLICEAFLLRRGSCPRHLLSACPQCWGCFTKRASSPEAQI